jgi:hypothetical protein
VKDNVKSKGLYAADPRFPFEAIPCGICGAQSGTETRVSPNTYVFHF